jgi:hypothetical protein
MRQYLESNGWECDQMPHKIEWYHIDYQGIVVTETGNDFILYIENVPYAYDLSAKQLAAIIKSIYHFQ